jgi:predicted DNA-binding protein
MQMKAFNVRLADEDLDRLSAKAKKRGMSKTELLRDWIRSDDDRTVANARLWEERNLGNSGLRIRCD